MEKQGRLLSVKETNTVQAFVLNTVREYYRTELSAPEVQKRIDAHIPRHLVTTTWQLLIDAIGVK